jgi:cysteine sulfinate desulfinase/cysteine desulfurase-like protein
LYHRSGSAPIHPIFFGGGQESGLRAGTENTPMIAGLGQASEVVVRRLRDDEAALREKRDLLEDLVKVKRICQWY